MPGLDARFRGYQDGCLNRRLGDNLQEQEGRNEPSAEYLYHSSKSFEIITLRKMLMEWRRWFGIALLLSPMFVLAQAYPNKPVHVVVSFPPGGSIDVTARIVFDHLRNQVGQEFVLDNRGGAAGTIAAAYFATRAPDGYTIMVHSATHIANAHLYKKLPYDTLNDFIGVTTLAKQVGVLVVHPSLPVKSVNQFIALAKKRPGAINYGSGGSGSFLHVSMALFADATGTKMVHVPYRGGGPAAIALISGETQAEIATLGSVVSFLKAKQMRAIGVTSAQRVKQFLEIPTIGETVSGYEFTAWVGCFAPAGTPRTLVDKLNGELRKTLADPGVAAKLNGLTLEPMHMTPEEFAQRLKSDYGRYGKLIKQAAAKVN